ncbi:MAG TPA: response regulator transcription factor [Ktedonobacteraceae bacterium]|nr:response regulator transcription factor [Ktedonobacteraceae bacterium]
MESQIRVMLADNQRLIREGLSAILEAAPDIVVVGEASDGASIVKLATAELPDVILMDVRMPVQDGITATSQIKQMCQNICIILLTSYDSPDLVVNGMRAGATGYLLKECSAEELRSAVRAVARGQHVLHVSSATHLFAHFALNTPFSNQTSVESFALTRRERDILPLIGRGYTNKEIATTLHISHTTVKTHMNHLFAKLGARDRAHAVVLAHQFGLMS